MDSLHVQVRGSEIWLLSSFSIYLWFPHQLWKSRAEGGCVAWFLGQKSGVLAFLQVSSQLFFVLVFSLYGGDVLLVIFLSSENIWILKSCIDVALFSASGLAGDQHCARTSYCVCGKAREKGSANFMSQDDPRHTRGLFCLLLLTYLGCSLSSAQCCPSNFCGSLGLVHLCFFLFQLSAVVWEKVVTLLILPTVRYWYIGCVCFFSLLIIHHHTALSYGFPLS